MNKRAWTKEELDLMKAYYEREGTEICKRLPERTEGAVKRMAQELGLYCRHPNNGWTEEEVAIIKEYYPVEGKKVINRLPGRSVSNIQVMANRLGVHKNKRK